MSSRFEGHRFWIMYHGTRLSAAQAIIRDGFRRSTDGMLGPGVYLSRSVEKVRRYPLDAQPGERLAILEVRVEVGLVIRIDYQGHPLQKIWHQHGYSTAWVPPNCLMVDSNLEENCVWDPARIEVLQMWEFQR
ncbi:hypothetical protein Baya_6698 [Bagarius yarrelli]|uniref:PARP catalytic domain-containing protein n=1 Tax=Bagarius yarrelli TaxID=175774 RepID=A0A556U1L4_BAGYA|nr:hypothetical protein Baya_6698 [Bagarius yarrelli]